MGREGGLVKLKRVGRWEVRLAGWERGGSRGGWDGWGELGEGRVRSLAVPGLNGEGLAGALRALERAVILPAVQSLRRSGSERGAVDLSAAPAGAELRNCVRTVADATV